MKQKPSSRRRRSSTKSILRLPDLEHAKAAVLNSLNSADAKRGYPHAIEEFVDWYCSEPRLAFDRIVVLRYRSHLESRQLAPGTVNLRLGAVRRLAYEAADCGLLSADLAAGIRRVKGVRKLGVRPADFSAQPHLAGAQSVHLLPLPAAHSCPRRGRGPCRRLPSRPAPHLRKLRSHAALDRRPDCIPAPTTLPHAGVDVRGSRRDLLLLQRPRLLHGCCLSHAAGHGRNRQ